MGAIKKYPKVKLIIGFIYKEQEVYKTAKSLLERRFGKIDYESRVIPFTHTTYYEKEFGRNLSRRFISFHKLILPQSLARIKNTTNKIENQLSRNKLRGINIDPGYLDLAKLILASTKDFAHRIYMDKGIFAEITLFFKDKSFRIWEWTYPDYRSPEYIEIFNAIRALYSSQLQGDP